MNNKISTTTRALQIKNKAPKKISLLLRVFIVMHF